MELASWNVNTSSSLIANKVGCTAARVGANDEEISRWLYWVERV